MRDAERREFDAWYLKEAPRLLACVTLVTGDRWLAEDATAEAFARALERWRTVRDARSASAWVYTVALNLVRTTIRRRGLERKLLGRSRGEVARPPDEPDVALWRAVARLPPRERSVVALRYIGDLSEAEIAAALGISRGTVSSTLHHARQRLAEKLATTHGGTL